MHLIGLGSSFLSLKRWDGLVFVGGMNPCDLLMKQFKKQFKVLGFHGHPQIDLLFYLAKQ